MFVITRTNAGELDEDFGVVGPFATSQAAMKAAGNILATEFSESWDSETYRLDTEELVILDLTSETEDGGHCSLVELHILPLRSA